ncbi:MAG: VWA domain-containing protein, partial [Bradyrhizobium sp.]
MSDVPSKSRFGSKTSPREGTSDERLPQAEPSGGDAIAAFVAQVRAMAPATQGARGRLVFALDATLSRQPTWDRACVIQAEMFDAAAALGGLDVKLVYFRGLDECRA